MSQLCHLSIQPVCGISSVQCISISPDNQTGKRQQEAKPTRPIAFIQAETVAEHGGQFTN